MIKLKISSWKGKEEFAEISNSSEPKLILFAAKWCGYCALFLKMAKELKAGSDIELVLINADDPDESLWDTYNLRLVPTLMVFQSGEQLFRKDGMSGIGLRPSDLNDALSFLSAKSKSV